MNELQAAVTIAMANTYVMGYKAHTYHWNVEGMFFHMFHDLFGEIYDDLNGAVDDLAERVRTIDGYAPISIVDLLRYATVREDDVKPATATAMVSNLLDACGETMASLNKAFAVAEQQNNQGLMDLIAGRLDAHAKLHWMLKSTLKNTGAY